MTSLFQAYIFSWKHHARVQIATMIVLIACLTVVSSIMILSNNLNRVLTLWGENSEVTVYLSENASEENKKSLESFLNKNEQVQKVQFLKKEDALAEFRQQMASYAPDLLADSELLKYIPASFRFSIKSSTLGFQSADIVQGLADKIKSMTGVDEVNYGQDWIKSYSAMTKTFHGIGLILIVITVFAAGFVVANSIHSAVIQRKSEIEVLELIGATSGFIRKPFLVEGAITGFLSSILALSMSFGIFDFLRNILTQQLSFLQLGQQVQFFDALSICYFICGSTLLGIFSAYICVRRINSGWAASQRSQ